MRQFFVVFGLLVLLTSQHPSFVAAQRPPTLPPAVFVQPTATYVNGLSRTNGSIVVWVLGEQIFAADLHEQVVMPIARGSCPDVSPYPATDGRYIIWSGLRGYDTVNDYAFRIPPNAPGASDLGMHIRGGAMVWNRGQDPKRGLTTLLAMPLDAALAPVAKPAPVPPPPPIMPLVRYFPETGHTLGPPFDAFWERSGGLPVFGYPLTDAFHEPAGDPAPGQAEAWPEVQYFERQRFEYHPEHRNSPYVVLLGRLGAEEATRRDDLRGLWAFNPVPPDAPHPPGCRCLAETGHRLCGEFRPYWERYGLEFGDPGVSFRESLALFGYPISEEFVDPATGLVTQYFERARFEWHPTNAAPYRVLLGRLAADRLAAWGWR